MAPASALAEDLPTASGTESATTYTRLHITPFDPSLQNLVIPASVFPRARNLSYHTIETFPEKRFGFVDLPTMDAEKIKKKLNGAVLKGAKIRVEAARPESIPEPTAATDTTKVTKKERKKSNKKRKHEPDVMEGVQLEGRKVKRGWTTTEHEMIEAKRKKAKKEKKEQGGSDDKKDKKDKKKKKTTVKSQYTDEPECLFKTKLPGPGPTEEAEDGASARKDKRKRKSDRKVIVHEFEKTTKYPTFLKSNLTGVSTEATTTFEDGVGWVDSSGKVVEPVKTKRRAEGIPVPNIPRPKKEAPVPQEDGDGEDDDDETSSSGTSSDEDDDASSSASESDVSNTQPEIPATPTKPRIETSIPSSRSTAAKPDSARPKSAGSITSLSIKIPTTSPAVKEIHPLEALYKRPQGDNGIPPEAKSFSFFGNEDDLEEDGSLAPAGQAPMTPFTKREFEFRNIRSAAPTPDTAHPSRSFHFWPSQRDDLEEGGEVSNDGAPETPDEEPEEADVNMDDGDAGAEAGQAPTSDFQKQFWESRGDLNRAWRKRRKSAAKEKRYRDNRARAERAI
ncbi:hypothetical protein F4861DRAFT_518772 [Xylaria intraflava]|nr:hypothetical protein F4861DRAFT_518772 [Xylaria intraflava]